MSLNTFKENVTESRLSFIKFNAVFDADPYIKFMESKLNRKLKLKSDGTLEINAVEGDKFFSSMRTKHNLTTEEMLVYTGSLKKAVEKKLAKK